MLALSGAFHLVLGIVALTVSSFQGNPIRLEPVAVVNLVGGGSFPKEPDAKPAAAPASPAPAPPASKDAAPVKIPPRAKTAKKPPKAAAVRGELSTPEKRVVPDISSVEERLRQMREARTGSDAVRRAIEEHRREAAARAAVRGVGERIARRIERPPENASAGAGIGGGSKGTARVAPELLEYFRKLEERVRESWVLPGELARDTANLMVELRIVIEKDGRVSDTRIEKGSGNVYFDDSVLRAIRKASPVPVPPARLRGGEDHYEVGFRFHGTGGGG